MAELLKVMDIMSDMDNYYKELYRILGKYVGQSVLDAGCGNGDFLFLMRGKKTLVGVDYEKSIIERTKKKLGKYRNMHFFHGDLSDPKFRSLIRKFKFDTVFSINVIEHIKDDRTTIKNLASLLQPDGTLIILVPGMSSLYGSIDKSVGHYRRYDKESLIAKVKEHNMEIVDAFYLKILEALGYYVVGKVLKKQLSSYEKRLKFYNKLIPFVWRIENLFRLPCGSSVVCIAKKK